MPPKGSTRGRGSGTRGRGRGRGRGQSSDASVAPPADSIAPSAVSQTLKIEDDESQSTLSGSPNPSVPQIAPEGLEAQNEGQSMDVDKSDIPTDPTTTPMDPNTSPASQPTETPASTPLRPAQEPPLVPAVLGGKVKKESRFKPKANRTAKSKLDELADQERRRKAQSAADEARAAGRAARGMDFRGMRGRGRGDAMGRGKVPSSSGAGLWGVAPEMQKGQAAPGSKKIPGMSGGGDGDSRKSGGASASTSKKGVDGITYRTDGTGGSGSGRGGGGGGSSGNASGPAAYEFEPAYPDEDETQRVDIAHINDFSSDEEPAVTNGRAKNWGHGRGRMQGKGMKPVRLDRVEHKPRKTIEVKEEKVEDMLLVNERPKKEKKESGSRVKPEPSSEDEFLSNTPTVPVNQATDNFETMDIDSDSDETLVKAPPSPETKKKISRLTKKDDMPIFQSEEDKQEYIRTQQDRAVLAEEIASMYRKPTDGDAMMDDDDNRHAGRTFLFQFPPRIPTLYDPLTSQKPPLPGEMAKIQMGEDIQIIGSKSGVKNPVDLSGKKKVSFAGPANPAERVIEIKEEELDEPQLEPSKNEYVNESGMVGRLVLRKSGKFELLWGGSKGNQLAVNKGVTNSFMSVSAVLEHPNGKAQKTGQPSLGSHSLGGAAQDEGARYGTASGMGKVMGKFVVTPDWDTMF